MSEAFVVLAALVLAVALVGALSILRMEASRRAVTAVDRVRGAVVAKRESAERAESSAPVAGGGAGIVFAPPSFVLTIGTPAGQRDLVVDERTFSSYEVGDAYP